MSNKTAMQELFEKLGYNQETLFCKEFLQKERQQIIDAFTSGEKDIINVFVEEFKNRGLDLEIGNINDDNEDAEKYYADTYN